MPKAKTKLEKAAQDVNPLKVQVPTNLADTTVILNLELSRVNNTARLKSDTKAVKTDIDRKMLHLSVSLFDSKELRECWNFLYALKAQIWRMTVPSFLRGGLYMIKVEGVEEVENLLNKAVEDFQPLVNSFAAVVDEQREKSKKMLGPAYDPSKFPSQEEVLQAFGIKWNWLSMSTPSSLKQIQKGLFEKEAAKAEESLRNAVEEIVVMLTVEAKELCDHLVERLTPNEDGKPKVFRESAVSNITEFLAHFNMRAVGTTKELQEQVERMRKLLSGVDAKTLRDNDQLKADVHAGFAKVAASLDKLVIAKPSRYIEKKAS